MVVFLYVFFCDDNTDFNLCISNLPCSTDLLYSYKVMEPTIFLSFSFTLRCNLYPSKRISSVSTYMPLILRIGISCATASFQQLHQQDFRQVKIQHSSMFRLDKSQKWILGSREMLRFVILRLARNEMHMLIPLL